MIVYISGPYTAPTYEMIKANIDEARYCAIRIMKLGHTVICPHTMTAFWDKYSKLTYKDFIKMDLKLVAISDAVFMLPGWRNSDGAIQEHAEAVRLGKLIYYTFGDIPRGEGASERIGEGCESNESG